MLISFFEGNSPGLDLGNLKVAEGLADGDGICPLRCLVLQDSPRGPFAVGERSEQPIGGFVFGGWFPAEWAEQVILDNYSIEVGIHRVLGGRWRGQALVTRSAVLHGFYRGNLRFGWLGFRFWCEDHPAADAECNTECNAEYGEESGDGLLHQRYLYLKGDPGADRMSTPGFSVVRAVRDYGVIPIKMATETVLCRHRLEFGTRLDGDEAFVNCASYRSVSDLPPWRFLRVGSGGGGGSQVLQPDPSQLGHPSGSGGSQVLQPDPSQL